MLFSAVQIEVFLPVNLEMGPYVNTLFGSIGVNTSKFCKDFKAKVAGLNVYMNVGVTISVEIDRTYKIDIWLPNLGFLIMLISIEGVVRIDSLILICNLKFGECTEKIFLSAVSTVKSMNLLLE